MYGGAFTLPDGAAFGVRIVGVGIDASARVGDTDWRVGIFCLIGGLAGVGGPGPLFERSILKPVF